MIRFSHSTCDLCLCRLSCLLHFINEDKLSHHVFCFLFLVLNIREQSLSVSVLPGDARPGSVGYSANVQFRFTVVPLVQQLVHLLLLWDPVKSVLFVLPVLLGRCDKVRMREMKHSVLPHVLKKLHYAFLCEVARMQHAGFIEKLLLHVEVVAPVPGLQEGAVVVKTGLYQATQCTQHDQEQEDGPANRLDRARKA